MTASPSGRAVAMGCASRRAAMAAQGASAENGADGEIEARHPRRPVQEDGDSLAGLGANLAALASFCLMSTAVRYEIRRARTQRELAEALKLRYDVFCVEQGVPEHEELDGRDHEGIHLIALAVDDATNIYVADTGNHAIRMLTSTGTSWVVSTIAGLPGAIVKNPRRASRSGSTFRPASR